MVSGQLNRGFTLHELKWVDCNQHLEGTRRPRRRVLPHFPLIIVSTVLFLTFSWRWGCSSLGLLSDQHDLETRSVSPPNSSILKVIEVDPPVRFNDESTFLSGDLCQTTLMTHSFGNSYGQPYVGPYQPPACQFNRVIWNMTVESAGVQFDRLGTVWLGGVEVFRTSTAEPTQAGIVWTYLKDMSSYTSLFQKQQTLIFDLGNLINQNYTAAYNVTLTASFYNVNSDQQAADMILAVSKGYSDKSSAFTFPSDNATSALTLPNNGIRAVFTLAATGQSNEEFWWSNVLQQDVNDFPAAGPVPGYSPFREVQLYIDGNLAGVAWPYPVIFTGGVVPGLWRPIVGIQAFDLKENEIDVTPWLPYLSDGNPHDFTIKVSGLVCTPDGKTVLSETVGNYWVLSGKLFLWLGASSQTVGQKPQFDVPPPVIYATSQFHNSTNVNETELDYQVSVARQLTIQGPVTLSAGQEPEPVAWHQQLQFHGGGTYSDGGNLQSNYLQIEGKDSGSFGYSRNISYPLSANSSQTMEGDRYILSASISRGERIQIFGQPVFPSGLESYGTVAPPGSGSLLDTVQDGQAKYIANTTDRSTVSFGETYQQMNFSAVQPQTNVQTELYYRDIEASNGTIVHDQQTDNGQDVHSDLGPPATVQDLMGFALVLSNGPSTDRLPTESSPSEENS